MTDEFNKGFRRGYDTALQDLNAFLELTGSIRDHTKEQDSNDILGSLLTHPYGTEEENGIQEPLKPYESHTCGQCSWDPKRGTYCVRAQGFVFQHTPACKDFLKRKEKTNE